MTEKEGSAAELAHEIARALGSHPLSGWLRLYGHWFGRPYDTTFRSRNAAAERDELVLTFAHGASARLSGPHSVSIAEGDGQGERASLVVRGAASVEMKWPMRADTVVEEYAPVGEQLQVRRTGPSRDQWSHDLDPQAPSLELVTWRE